jgi:hypothetical protein
VPTLLNALQVVLTLLSGSIPGIQQVIGIVQLIKLGVADLITAIQQWKATPTSGTLNTIETLLANVAAEFQNLLGLVPGSSVAASLLNLIVSTLAGFLQNLPTPAGMKPQGRLALRFGIVAKYRSVGEFKKEFNRILVSSNQGQHQIK